MASRSRHVLITGGSRGIGLAVAQLFSKNAYRCTLISRSKEDLQQAVASLTPLPSSASQDSPPDTEAYQHGYIAGNISEDTSFWKPEAISPFGAILPRPGKGDGPTHPSRIDVVVNCAGITQTSLFLGMSIEEMNKIIDTNLMSVMRGTKFLLRYCNLSYPRTRHVGSCSYMHLC